MTTVSIVIPTYNRENFLPRAVESVLSQTYDDIEIIVVDDGSTDGTPEVMEKYAENENVRYVRKEENAGANVARNDGVRKSEGEYVMFLDSDDELLSNAVERCIDILQNRSENCRGVLPSYNLIEGEKNSVKKAPDGEIELNDILNDEIPKGFSGLLVRKDVFDEVGYLDVDLRKAQDVDFLIRVLEEFCLLGETEPLYNHYVHSEDQISSNPERIVKGETRIIEKHGDKLTAEHRADRYHSRGMAHAEQGNMKEASSDFKRAIREYPTKWYFYYHYVLSKLGRRVFELGTPQS